MKITGYDLAIEPGHRDGYYFSMDPSKVVESLNGLIDGIKSGKLRLLRATFETESKEDDFTATRVYLMFAEKQ